MTTLLLIRHAANDWVGKRLAGWLPGVHLNEEGKRQATQLAQRLAEMPIVAVYASPLERALETAQAIARPRGLDVQVCEDLGEVRYGEWEGRAFEELQKTDLWPRVQAYPSGTRFPGGETLREVQSRVVAALENILQAYPHDRDVVAVVSHGDAIRTAVAHYVGIHLDLFQRLVINPASVTVITFGEMGPRLVRLNDDGPIRPPPEPESGEGGAERQRGRGAKEHGGGGIGEQDARSWGSAGAGHLYAAGGENPERPRGNHQREG